MRAPSRVLLLLVAIFLLASTALVEAEAERVVGYLYVEANEGGSSGGHVAVRFDDETFHFQHETPGVLRLYSEDSADFLFRYAMLANRGVRQSRIAVSADTFELLRDEFSRRALIQSAQFDALQAARADVDLIQTLSTGARQQIPLDGFGYFPESGGAGHSAALLSLRQCVRRAQGPSFIEEQRAQISGALRQLRPDSAPGAEVALSAADYPALAPFFSVRYTDLIAAGEALRILDEAPTLKVETYREPPGEPFAVSPVEADRLGELARTLADELCQLAASSRPDRGTALAMGMARLAALELSAQRGHWVFLDPYGPTARQAPLPEGKQRDEYLDVLEHESLADFRTARAEMLAASRFRETSYGALETAGNRLLEAGAARVGQRLRVQAGLSLPSLPGSVDLVPTVWGAAESLLYLQAARSTESRLEAQLARIYRYDLVRRNCVSELFTTIDEAFSALPSVRASPDRAEAVRAESRRRLGGHIDTDFNLNFIPVASEAAVASAYRVVDRRQFASYRQRRVETMLRDEPAWRVWLRESNTLTSDAYRPGADDSSFLFFAEEPAVARPLFGAANLVFSLGDGALGLATLPIAGPRRFVRGLRGALFSLPELGFVNLRKGTTSFAERQWASDEM